MKLKTKELLELDYSKEENKNKIQKVLKSIKPLSSFQDEEIPLYALEKIVHTMCHKYLIYISSMHQDCWANTYFDIWRANIVNDDNKPKTYVVYGLSLYELFAKLVIFIYSESKKGNLKERS